MLISSLSFSYDSTCFSTVLTASGLILLASESCSSFIISKILETVLCKCFISSSLIETLSNSDLYACAILIASSLSLRSSLIISLYVFLIFSIFFSFLIDFILLETAVAVPLKLIVLM